AVQYLQTGVHSRPERLGERVRQSCRASVDRLHPVGEGVLHLVLDLVERPTDELVSPVQLRRIDVHAQLMQLDGLEGILQLRDINKVAADSPIQHLERDTQLLKAIRSTWETEHRVERGHQLMHLFEFARDPTPELVDPSNLPRTLLRPFYGAQQRIVESLHAGSPVKGALGRVASPLLEIVDRAPVLVADVLQRLLVTGDGCGQTLIPSDSEVERIPD